MVPALQFDYWQWFALQLATPVVLWGGWPFHRAAWANLQHGTATMDTLISLGTLAAWGWSVVALFLLDAGQPGMTMPFDLVPDRDAGVERDLPRGRVGGHGLHPGRALLRGCARSGVRARRCGRCWSSGAKDVAVLDDAGRERRVPVEQLAVGDRFVVRPGEKIATDGVVEEGRSAVDMSLLTGESVPVEVEPGQRGRRRDDQRGRPPGRARHAGRRRHRAGRHRAPGDRGAGRQGARRSGSPTASPACSCRS